ncbi:ferredoxin reductase-like protein [Tothia fuscella]|uniref:NADH-cytochrome b5 reductase n=1 Tax=Tothia fuscella TaxID=1048955 RepID=A0A9P4NP22_9PEZI|nr:ferredoxin reductase-like protein [Tothia fuscella]
MFARQVLRPAKVVSTHVRTYAALPTPSNGGGKGLRYAGFASIFVTGMYAYYYITDPMERWGIKRKNEIEAEAPSSLPSTKVFTGGDQGFISLKLQEVENINHNTKKLRFGFEDENAVSGLVIASALLTKYKGPEMEKPVMRPYTPVSDENTKGHIDLLIKVYPNGPMSEHMHSMTPGQRLDFKGPLPKYPWSPNKHEHIALLAGGTGITPMYQLIRSIFNNPEDKTKVTLVFGNVTEEDILLKHEFEELENTYPRRFKAFYVLDNPPEKWQQGKGFITKELLKTVLPEPKEGEKVKIFVCGPPPLYKAISGMKKSPADQGELNGYLKELGYSKDQVYKF